MTGEWGKGGGGEAYVDLTSQTRGTKISLSYFRIQKPAGLIGSKQSWASKKKNLLLIKMSRLNKLKLILAQESARKYI